MLKYYLITFALSLIVILRAIFSNDVSATYQFLSLLVLIFSSAFAALELKDFVSDNFDKMIEPDETRETEGDSAGILFSDFGNYFENNLIRLGHLLHLANPKAEITAKTTYALGCAHEQLPDKIFLFHRLKESELKFITGTRKGSNSVYERILEQDPLVEEVYARINGLLDIKALNRSAHFSASLPFKRKADESQCLLLPVAFFGQLKGILTVISPTGSGFSKNEKKVLEFFAESFSILLENHELFEREQTDLLIDSEQRLCHELFVTQLPDSTPVLQGWEISVHCHHAAGYSGDFHDFFNLPDNRCMIIIGKASNGGLDAALFFLRLKTMIRCLINQVKSPADLLNQLSVKLTEEGVEELFATMLVIQIKASEAEIQIACAGHNLPLINRTRNGFVESPNLETGVPIGLFNQSPEPYNNQTMQLLPGDGVLFYTDGITEYGRKNGERISVEEIKLTLDKIPELSAHETLENLINELMIESKDVKNPPEDQTGIYLKLE
jgi:hypothetical protein